MSPAFRGVSIGAILAIALLACGGGGGDPVSPGPGSGPGPGPAPSPSPNTVVMGGSSFNPTSLTIQRNGTVTWNNASGILHNVTFTTSGSPSNIGNHTSGTNDRTFTIAGTFDYNCTLHGGMNGAITVQ